MMNINRPTPPFGHPSEEGNAYSELICIEFPSIGGVPEGRGGFSQRLENPLLGGVPEGRGGFSGSGCL